MTDRQRAEKAGVIGLDPERAARVLTGSVQLAGEIYTRAGQMAGAVKPVEEENFVGPICLVKPPTITEEALEALPLPVSMMELRKILIECGFVPVLVLVPESHFKGKFQLKGREFDVFSFRLMHRIGEEAHKQLMSPEQDPCWGPISTGQGEEGMARLVEEVDMSMTLEDVGMAAIGQDLIPVLILVPLGGLMGLTGERRH